MFAKRMRVQYVAGNNGASPCPLPWIDNFAMRNFTNDSVFDDTLPVADGVIEIGNRVPLDRLHTAMDDWFRRKGYLKPGDALVLSDFSESETRQA